jgi:murein L,D-transpeptidase YafK
MLRLLFLLPLVGIFFVSGCAFRDETSPQPLPSATPTVSVTKTDPWILVDSRSEKLTVYRNEIPVAEFRNIAFGAAGVREKVRQGDDVTPRGSYRIGWISHKSKFHLFIGLDYPSKSDAERGLRNGVITKPVFDRIIAAHDAGRTPPQTTRLGGLIGIHGVGRGDLEIHRLVNWTAGCIALENHEIGELARFVRPGVVVEIR